MHCPSRAITWTYQQAPAAEQEGPAHNPLVNSPSTPRTVCRRHHLAIRSHPCLKVNARVPLDGWEACEAFLKLPLTTPVSTGCPHEWRVPRLYHAVGKDNTPPAAV